MFFDHNIKEEYADQDDDFIIIENLKLVVISNKYLKDFKMEDMPKLIFKSINLGYKFYELCVKIQGFGVIFEAMGHIKAE